MNAPLTSDVILTVLGGTLLVLGLSAGLVRNRWYVSEPLLALAIGVGVSGWLPHLAVLDDEAARRVAEQVVRLTLTITLVDIAMELPAGYLRHQWRPLLTMLAVVMPLMWIATSALVWWVVGSGVVWAVTLGAVLTPTDPVVAASIASGTLAERSVPARLRRLVMAESGANDALALLLVSSSLFMLGVTEASSGWGWLTHILVVEIGGGVALGAGAGWVTVKAMLFAERQRDSDRTSLITVALSLAVTLLGAAGLMNSDGILAAFIAGLVMNQYVTGDLAAQKTAFHGTFRRFFELPVFLLLGIVLPWDDWFALGWPAVILVLLLLLLRRLPAVLLLQGALAPVEHRRDAWFLGWFGPIGVAALYYALLAVDRSQDPRIWIWTTLVVTASVLVHGLTATHWTIGYGNWRFAESRSSQQYEE